MASLGMDGAELFNECLAQATLVVKQVLPSHYTNATPDAEWDVRDLTSHMLLLVERLPQVLEQASLPDDEIVDDGLDQSVVDFSVSWQLAADRAEAAAEEADLEATIRYNNEEMTIEGYLLQAAGDLLIHSWDLGEAIGMPVRFAPAVAEAVMETTHIPNISSSPQHNLFQPLDTPPNADLQTRLLALFGRSNSWRVSA